MKANSRSTTANPIGQRARFQNQVNASTLVGARCDRVPELPAENDQEQVSGEDGSRRRAHSTREISRTFQSGASPPCRRRGSRP